MLALTTRLSKLEEKYMSLQHHREEEGIETRPKTTPTINEGTPTRVLLRD